MFRPLATLLIPALAAAAAFADPVAPPPAAADAEGPAATTNAEIYVYAAHGQTDGQLDRDRYECHNWAVAQSHYNPSDPHLAPHQQIQVVAAPPPGRNTVAGAIAGAVTGAIIAGPHDADRGAVIGAVAGGAMGAASESAQRREAERINGQNAAGAQAERARLETEASNYRRAISACLEGRGYTVK
jgi:hypothetical protein